MKKIKIVLAVAFAAVVAIWWSMTVPLTLSCHQLDQYERYLCQADQSITRFVDTFYSSRTSEAEYNAAKEEFFFRMIKDMISKGLIPDQDMTDEELKKFMKKTLRKLNGQPI